MNLPLLESLVPGSLQIGLFLLTYLVHSTLALAAAGATSGNSLVGKRRRESSW